MGSLERDRPTVVYCMSGYRSAIAASVLRAAGIQDVSDLVGGYGAWSGAHLPTSVPTLRSGTGPASESSEGSPTMTVEVPEVTPEETAALLAAGALLLDVREADEWQAGHAPTATHVPMREVPERIDEIPSDRRVVAICRSGGRSRAVAEALIGAGFDVVNVSGGMRAWEAADLPIETDDGAPGVVA
jgi:rhodanese-related sulfurtransferase